MTSHQFHYKSPDELKKELTKRSTTSKSRRRALLIILADLGISAIVLAALFYGGFLGKSKLESTSKLQTKWSEIHASLEMEDNHAVLYIYVKNIANEGREFPENSIPAKIILYPKPQAKDKADASDSFSLEFTLKKKSIQAGETVIYRQEVSLPASTKIQRAELLLAQGDLVLE